MNKPNEYSALSLLVVISLVVLGGCQTRVESSGKGAAKLFQYDGNLHARWSSPENKNGVKGSGGKENHQAKGHAFDAIPAGSTYSLLDVQGQGMVTRIWITINDRSPEMLRALKLEMFWDDASRPAVAVPLGDFFGVGLGRTAVFHNALFSNPEGRSFNCYIPMPFRKAARIQITNESSTDLRNIFFDVDYEMMEEWNPDNLYFHTYWSRDTATTLAKDFQLLPPVAGKGRYLGVNVGINSNPAYKDAWWGEGEVKVYLDGDTDYPTLNGTGTEDYIGTAWGQGVFFNDYTGCLIGDSKNFQWTFYRYHLPDPIFFSSGCRIDLQQIGGHMKANVAALQKEGAPLIPVTLDHDGEMIQLYQPGSVVDAADPKLPDGWMNFYRSDDVSATVYFYLSSAENSLPLLQPVSYRVK